MESKDPCTFSKPESFLITHAHFDVDLDFTNKVYHSTSIFTVKVLTKDAVLILDTNKLLVDAVYIRYPSRDQFIPARFQLLEEHKIFGRPLSIEIDIDQLASSTEELQLKAVSRTTDECEGLQWMGPEQTVGKKHPYLMSQCQATYARTMFPCQDTPGVKFTYTATVSLPKELSVVMSALNCESPSGDAAPMSNVRDKDPNKATYHFSQPVPISSYLFAIAAGHLVKGDLSARSAVYCEPEQLSACLYEFEPIEKLLQAAEAICGPYIWSNRYDFLVLPPSFPFGGMENANMTFLSPTLLAGDRSMLFVLAHEIGHSWTGNLVTNCSWNHFWLNEGWNVFIERKIIAKFLNDPESEKFLYTRGMHSLIDDMIAQKNDGKEKFTALVIDFTNDDPEEAFCKVPYEKGSNLLYYLQNLLGGPSKFEPYIKKYIDYFKDTPVDSLSWKNHLISCFPGDADVLKSLPWDDIFLKPGPLPFENDFTNANSAKCQTLAESIISTCVKDYESLFGNEDLSKWSNLMFCEVLANIPVGKFKFTSAQYQFLEDKLGFKLTKNAPLLSAWHRVGIRSELEETIAPSVKFLEDVGENKYTRSLIRDMNAWEKSRPFVVDYFQRQEKFMNPITVHNYKRDLNLS